MVNDNIKIKITKEERIILNKLLSKEYYRVSGLKDNYYNARDKKAIANVMNLEDKEEPVELFN